MRAWTPSSSRSSPKPSGSSAGVKAPSTMALVRAGNRMGVPVEQLAVETVPFLVVDFVIVEPLLGEVADESGDEQEGLVLLSCGQAGLLQGRDRGIHPAELARSHGLPAHRGSRE